MAGLVAPAEILPTFENISVDFLGEHLVVDAVAVAGGLASHDDAEWSCAAVHGLVGLARSDFDALPCFEGEVVVFDFHGELAGENVEELAGSGVMVARLGGAGGHELFDDAEVGGLDELPAVAVVSPGVVLGGGGVDDFGGHEYRV